MLRDVIACTGDAKIPLYEVVQSIVSLDERSDLTDKTTWQKTFNLNPLEGPAKLPFG